MQIDLTRFRDVFFEEAIEHHQALEAGLLRLESAADDREALDAVFRAAHSIKGSSGVFDLPDVTRFTHAMESLLDRMRKGATPITRESIETLLAGADVLRALIATARVGGSAPTELEATLARLGAASAVPQSAPTLTAVDDRVRSMRWLQIEIVPHAELLLRGMDPLLLLRDLGQLGRCVDIRADTTRLPALADLDPERCYLSWCLRLETTAALDEVREVFAFVEGDCRVSIVSEVDEGRAAEVPPLREVGGPPVAQVGQNDGPGPGESPDRRENRDRRSQESGSIRVAVEKVDHLVDLVGELVIAQSIVHQAIESFSPERVSILREAINGMGRNMRELQERVMSVRMVPIRNVFSRFPRLVRDLAASTGKSVALQLSGEDTEIDKGMVEKIGDPLTHLVRNCLDHGLESPRERGATNKPQAGVIRLSAAHEGGNVVLEVSDDGRGLDLERIRAKGVELGLVGADAQLSETDALELIFRPGFSTANAVSDISGRGVGMDVVKRNVEALNGTISVESQRGAGTRFRIRLPLTLAILDGLVVGVGAQTYILPLLSIVESVRLGPGDARSLLGRGGVATVRGEPLPLLWLSALLEVPDAEPEPSRGIVVIVEHAGRRVGILVDRLVGQAQVVLKNLEANFRRVEGAMGATILGDGTVALILDPQGLIRIAQRTTATTPAMELAGSQA